MSKHTAQYMRWHKNRDVVDGKLTHPANGDEWKQFDRAFPSFANEVRNVRLGLASDGFEPFIINMLRSIVFGLFLLLYTTFHCLCA